MGFLKVISTPSRMPSGKLMRTEMALIRERHAEAAQQAEHVFSLQQDFKTQIRHSAPSFPANCPAETPAAG